jgi:hypothetical protein
MSDCLMEAKEPGPPNVRIRALIPLHVGVQPTLGDSCNEIDIRNNPLRRRKWEQVWSDDIFFLVGVCHVADSFRKEQEEIKMLGR